jgi:hypothetical protein
VKHIIGAAQYAAYAHELAGRDPEAILNRAIERVPTVVRDVLRRYPDGTPGRSRLGELHRRLESALRQSSPS